MIAFRTEAFFEMMDLRCYLIEYRMNSRRTPYWWVQTEQSNPTSGLIINIDVLRSLCFFVLPNTLYREVESQPLRLISSEKEGRRMISAYAYLYEV